MGDDFEESIEKTIPWLTTKKENGDRIDPKLGDLRSTHSYMYDHPYLEVKKNAMNQIRPWGYHITIGRNVSQDILFVIPPEDIIRKAIDRKGQHTINAMECVNFNIPTATNWAQKYIVDADDLPNKILEIHKESHSSKNIGIKNFAKECRERVESLVEQQRQILAEIDNAS